MELDSPAMTPTIAAPAVLDDLDNLEPEPELEPEHSDSSGGGHWSSEHRSWDSRFSDDFELAFASIYAPMRLRLAQSSPWAARDPDSTEEIGHTGLTVWDPAIVLTKFLEHEHLGRNGAGMLRGKVVLELGSGAGLLGLGALHLGAKRVYCTEYSQDLPVQRLLESNLRANMADGLSDVICVRALDWGEDALPSWIADEVVSQDGGLDIILASEVIYQQVLSLACHRHTHTIQ